MKTIDTTFTVSIFTENTIGMLNRITIIFTRRHLNIDSITASETEVKNVHRYTIVLRTNREQIDKVVGQIDKLIDVLKAFVHEDNEVVHQEIALYKIKTTELKSNNVEQVVRENNAKVLTVDPDFIVIEKTGHKEEIQVLFEKLKTFGILEFARSGRVAVTKPMKDLTSYLKEFEKK
ncbi:MULTISPECIES: acetolactate synthase small subunit [Flavobacteriaceae]|jgi:acetolactate synthase-1/3 small subunit|uniref:Acetolactate synthase small subunit n=1 Tax=Aequorivita marisscotiae TaxID=3040348 RepID=A0ABY8KYG3_9FLAO|nr:acetolactate synthase small subunit [Aequorivita sp. Ant34-E75]MBS7360500.1 acetolactate synthase small subunit [Oscillospiraceae bacterium]WGF93998.1 acetolactate synthase small subunit [Aequorivita sp. Ant34-E75]|tara:strand:- start:99 stop:629 length:531 start_codon:yes stop_codon:yes gene_type:complete